ncbi:MAG: DNA mismatch repair protein MutS, partial [Clostridia bacterium]|nr:DNA mismatch repair protein MutS [Clostridia bacterium]
LLWLLDKTKTSMGARYLRNLVEQPLYNEKLINYRLKSVEELVKNIYLREEIGEVLYNIYDIERICGKISYGNITPKDCNSLKHSLSMLPKLKDLLKTFKSDLLTDVADNIYDYSEIVNLISNAIVENPPMNLKDGGYIKAGYSQELDELNNISKNGKKWILELEAKEKEETGIKNLKISYNKVFGYYIEVTNSQKDLVPYHYQRRQTIANAERFVTEELKQMEEKILNAEQLILELEDKLFKDICKTLKDNIISMQESSRAIALLDAILSFANVAVENNYVKPTITKDSVISITDGRHPIVEAILKNEEFVPNDTLLNNSDCRTMIITGPNMAGKSTYMRQVALITFMAHIGSFVPAKAATIGLTDRIFTRVGASDDLSFGQSTFMVEMVEVSNILKNATNNSLIILDEVGRGTSTFDGLSIAWSVMDYISNHLLAKTLFSTHYHELTDLEGILDGVKNYQISVKEFNDSVIFLRKIVRGGANRSFGIEVASLAGLPDEVLQNARKILKSLEEKELSSESKVASVNDKYAQKDKILHKNSKQVISILNDLDLNTLSPLGAFDILIQLKNYLDKE